MRQKALSVATAAIAVQQVCTAVYLWVVVCPSEQLAVIVTELLQFSRLQ